MCLGIPGRIVAVQDPARLLATVEIGGVRRVVGIACIVDAEHPPETCIGEWVLIHVGFAMARIDEVEAARTLELMQSLGEVQAEIDALRLDPDAQTTP
jgi:hydrogenase expression/formation protein HypC